MKACPEAQRRVGIIGGGVAGLAAAYRLCQRGFQVHLLEAGPTLGGLVGTFEIGGGRIEQFYHHIFSTDTTIAALIQELGLADRLVWHESKVGIFYDGRIYDFVTPLDLLRFTPISLIDRLRLGLVGLYLRRQKEWRRYESITAREWIIKYAGRRNYDVVWGPLLRGKFGQRADDISMAWFWSKIHLRFASRKGGPLQKEQLGYLMSSFGLLVDVLGERIRQMGGTLETSRPVQRVVVENGRAVALEVGGPKGQKVPCDAIIAAVPNQVFLRLTPSLPEAYAAKLRGVQYQWALCLVLALKRSLSPIYWMNISDRSIPFLALIEHTNFIDRSHYGGLHVAYLSNYLDEASPLLQMEIDELCRLYFPHLGRINPAFSPEWVADRWLFRGPYAQPIIATHYSDAIPEPRTPIEGLYLANMTQIYPEDRGQNYSIRLGEQVAALAASDLERAGTAVYH
ncbi:MAG: NAD(P)/FAD-dependent oxidoreductase [Chloroflexota bacterium]|nr:NAD(P)/FAD-dependent oxidoreductase [Chloroflexota bacterium]